VKPVRFFIRQNGTHRVPPAHEVGLAAAVIAATAAVAAATAVVSAAAVAPAEAVSAAAAQNQNDNDDEPQTGAIVIPRVKAHVFVTSLQVFATVYAARCQRETWPSKFFTHREITGGMTEYV